MLSDTTNLLVGTNFGFNLPSASIIQGIELDLNVGCDYFCYDSEIYLRQNFNIAFVESIHN